MSSPPVLPLPAPDRPVFVLGERQAAMQLVRALGDTPTLCALPGNRVLHDLLSAVERAGAELAPLAGSTPGGSALAARWYRDVQAAWLRPSGKERTVEFSGLSVLRLCELFPSAQFVVVHQLKRAIPRSRRLPPSGRERILEVDSARAAEPDTIDDVLAFLGEPEQVVLDLSDDRVVSTA
jgi:hypothetical protein